MSIKKVASAAALARRLVNLRRRKKIVFTNGCFDILHRGHVEYLSKAKSLGDVLIVGLNTDESVRRLKGPGRPVNSLDGRAAVLSALEMVDHVVPFSESTPLRLIQKLKPNVLVKGADYKEKDIVGSDAVRDGGGRVVRVALTPGYSTTSAIKKINSKIQSLIPYRREMASSANTLIVIPARFGSTRFPGKALANLGGKSVLQHVYEKAVRASKKGWKVVIATDDRRIFDAAQGFGAEVAMTPKSCKSGSDRCAVIAGRPAYSVYPIIVNLQGDEPFQPPENIRLAVQTLTRSSCPAATLAAGCPKKDIGNPNVAKVAISNGRAVFFSRSPIPFDRDGGGKRQRFFKHIGLYVFRRDFLLQFTKWPETPLERTEKLEQLRILENGRPIAVAVTPRDSIGIDTPADLARARRMLRGSF